MDDQTESTDSQSTPQKKAKVGSVALGAAIVGGSAAIGGWAGPALAIIGIGTAPAWAAPAAIGGAAVAAGGAAIAAYKFVKSRGGKKKA